MSHSNIVKDLLHKLSKNEFLAQDGGYQTYSNKAIQYRNQLNSLYGAGRDDDDRLVDEINQNIDQLIPVSLLEQYALEAQRKVDAFVAEQTRLTQQINQLEQAAANGDRNAKQTIQGLQQELDKIKGEMEQLTTELAQKETKLSASAAKLQETEADLANLRAKLTEVKNKTDRVKDSTTMSATVQDLFDKLRRVTAPAPSSASAPARASSRVSSSASSQPAPASPTVAPVLAPAPDAALALASPSTTTTTD